MRKIKLLEELCSSDTLLAEQAEREENKKKRPNKTVRDTSKQDAIKGMKL